MRLTRLEQETIFLYNEAEQTATVDTCNAALMRKLDGFCAKSTAITVLAEDDHSKRYLLPKTWVRVQMPRQLSDEQRQKLREQAKTQLNSNKRKGDQQ